MTLVCRAIDTLWEKEDPTANAMPSQPDATCSDPARFEEEAKIAVWIHDGTDPRKSVGKWFVVRYSPSPCVLSSSFASLASYTTLALTSALCTGPD